MKKYLIVLSSFVSMLCLGGVYGWSIIAAELIKGYNFSTTQTQVVFGTIIAIFPITMIFVGKLSKKIDPRFLAYLSSILFFSGYFLAGSAHGNFPLVLIGIGVLAGIATGFGYWVFLTIPVQWFPERKGLITGIAAAGFGLGAVLLSTIADRLLISGKDISQLLITIGVVYGLIIFAFSNFIIRPSINNLAGHNQPPKFLSSTLFYKLFFGIFSGTFAGLMIVGSLKLIGAQSAIPNHTLVLGVSLLAVANFMGRIIWGFLSDYIGASLAIFFALTVQALAILFFGITSLNGYSYIILSFLIGFGFGGNFVLFARETAQAYGVNNLGIIYPYVFLGYAVAGLLGPSIGGLLFDYFGSFTIAVILASVVSSCGGVLFLIYHLKTH